MTGQSQNEMEAAARRSQGVINSWAMYDWANSAFATVIMEAVLLSLNPLRLQTLQRQGHKHAAIWLGMKRNILTTFLRPLVFLSERLSLLLNCPNVLSTAQQAFLTREVLSEIARVTTANVLQLETGEPFLAGTTL